MKKVTLFYLEGCPYCHNARKAVAELQKENKDYADIGVNWVEEDDHPEISSQYDYYYVPTIFFGDRKLYEANPSENYQDCKHKVQQAFEAVLAYE